MRAWSRRSFVSLAAGAPALAFLTSSSTGAEQVPGIRITRRRRGGRPQ